MEAAAGSLGYLHLTLHMGAAKLLPGESEESEVPSHLSVLPSPCTVSVCCPLLLSC